MRRSCRAASATVRAARGSSSTDSPSGASRPAWSSLATGFAMLLALRGFVALGEATYYPTATALISDWHRPAMRSRALSHPSDRGVRGRRASARCRRPDRRPAGLASAVRHLCSGGVVWCVILSDAARRADPRRRTTRARRDGRSSGRCVSSFNAAGAVLCAACFSSPLALRPASPSGRRHMCTTRSVWISRTRRCTARRPSTSRGCLSVPFGGLLADTLAASARPIGRFYTLAIGLGLAGMLLLPLIGARSARADRNGAARLPASARASSTAASTRRCTTSCRAKRAPPRSG